MPLHAGTMRTHRWNGRRGRAFHRDLDMLTPSLPLSRSLDLPVCLARFPAARLWLKDESLEDTANLAGLSSMPGFPRHTQNLDASRRKVGSRFLRAANARSRHHRAGDRQISLSLD